MTFALDRYEPVAFHTHPELVRAAEAPPPVPATVPPIEPIAAYLVGMDATATLRAGLADFLDAAGARRDVRVSVGLAGGRDITWVLRDQVPFGVRALPRYPEIPPPTDLSAVLATVAGAVADDAAPDPRRRQLVVLVWDRTPFPLVRPPALGATLVVHAMDAVLAPPPGDGSTGGWLLTLSRPGPSPSLLGHAGRLLDRWEAFAAPPRGLVLGRLPESA